MNSGIRKSAIFLIMIGQEFATDILKSLKQEEVQKLGLAMSSLKKIPPQEIQQVMDEAVDLYENGSSVNLDSDNFLKNVLNTTMGDSADDMLGRILHGADTTGIQSLSVIDEETIFMMIKNEHPQIIATIIANLNRQQGANILRLFPDELRNQVILRIINMDTVQQTALMELNESVNKITSAGSGSIKSGTIGGMKTAAELIGMLGPQYEAKVIENIRDHNVDYAQKILDQMFTFEDIGTLDDKSVQGILKEIPAESLLLALKGTTDKMKQKVFNNMSKRAVETLKEDMESKGPVKISDVEKEKKEILKIVRKMAEEGKVELNRNSDDYV